MSSPYPSPISDEQDDYSQVTQADLGRATRRVGLKPTPRDEHVTILRSEAEGEENTMSSLRRLSTPIKIGLAFGLLGLLLTGIGIARGNVPPQPASIAVALLIGGGVWFVVAWAVAAAAVDVEKDVNG